MPSRSVQQAHLLIALSLTSITCATPQVAFPINSQLPLVAYVSRPYDFAFSPNTVTGSTEPLTYALTDQPSWLSIDNASRRLLGTPTSGDVGAPKFQLVASNANGQVSTSVTLVVLKEQTLSVGSGQIISQLASAGNVSAPATLLLRPQQVFDFRASPDCFHGVSNSTNYYAVSSDGTPLPSWLQFNPSSLRFSGSAPLLLAQNPVQQSFSFRLVASNVVGFSEVSVQFEIVTCDRILAFNVSFLEIKATTKAFIQTPSLLNKLFIDGAVVNRGQLTSADANKPAWLNFNNNDLSFNGTVPEDASNSTFFLNVGSSGTNTARVSIRLQVDNATNISTTPSAPTSSGEAMPTHSSGARSPANDDSLSGKRLAALILAIVLPILAIFFLICIIVAWLRKRKKEGRKPCGGITSEPALRPPTHRTESESGDELSMPGSVVPYESPPHAMSSVPQIDLSWAPDSIKRTRRRLSKKPRSPSTTIGSSWDDLVDIRARIRDSLPPMPFSTTTGDARKDSSATLILRPPAQRTPPKRPRRPDSPFREHRSAASHVSKTSSVGTKQTTGLPHRLSAAGHGAGGSQNTVFVNPQPSWQTTLGSLPALPSTNPVTVAAAAAAATTAHISTSPPRRKNDNVPDSWLAQSISDDSNSSTAEREHVHFENDNHNPRLYMDHTRTTSSTLLTPTKANKGQGRLPQITEDRQGLAASSDKKGRHPPPVPQKSAARAGRSQSSSPASLVRDLRTQTSIEREMSIASSHQFDSALSSDSQWEDENVVLDDSAMSGRYQEHKAEFVTRTPSLRLPFEPYGGSATRRVHIADQRKHVNLEHSALQREEQSHKGSFRFI